MTQPQHPQRPATREPEAPATRHVAYNRDGQRWVFRWEQGFEALMLRHILGLIDNPETELDAIDAEVLTQVLCGEFGFPNPESLTSAADGTD